MLAWRTEREKLTLNPSNTLYCVYFTIHIKSLCILGPSNSFQFTVPHTTISYQKSSAIDYHHIIQLRVYLLRVSHQCVSLIGKAFGEFDRCSIHFNQRHCYTCMLYIMCIMVWPYQCYRHLSCGKIMISISCQCFHRFIMDVCIYSLIYWLLASINRSMFVTRIEKEEKKSSQQFRMFAKKHKGLEMCVG